MSGEYAEAFKKRNPGLTPPSEGHKPKNARAAAAVAQLGRKKVTGNFKKIEKSKGKGAAIAAFQNARKAHGS
jgi:hypothetical protein